MPTTREYKIVESNSIQLLEEKLNQEAQKGFEAVVAFPRGGEYTAVILSKIKEGNRVDVPNRIKA